MGLPALAPARMLAVILIAPGSLLTPSAASADSASVRRNFIISEFGMHWPIAGPGAPSAYYTYDLGMMSSVGPATAVGGGFLFAAGQGGGRLGIRPRIRLRDDRALSIDLAPGVVLAGEHLNREVEPLGFSGMVQLTLDDWLSLTLQQEFLRLARESSLYPDSTVAEETTMGVTYLGVKIGRGLSLAAMFFAVMVGVAIDIAGQEFQ